MPIHDWTRVEAGVYHSFHVVWLAAIHTRLNTGALPPGYYAMAEHDVSGYKADVLTLRSRRPKPGGGAGPAVAVRPVAAPAARFTDTAARKRSRPPHRWIAVKKNQTDETVAVIELVSPGNKSSRDAFRAFVRKSVDLIDRGIHLLVVDPFPPGRRDPHGMHAAIWSELTGRKFELPTDTPLTVASYEAGDPVRAFVEPVAVGQPFPGLPLFLAPDQHIGAPIEETYMATWASFPERWRDELEPPAP